MKLKKFTSLMLAAVMVIGSALPASAKETTADEDMLLHYDFSNVEGTTVKDSSGKGHDGTIRGSGYQVSGNALTLPGGASGSTAAYVEIPAGTFDKQNTLTVSVWLKNETGAGNYAGMFFGNASNYWLLNPCNPNGYFKSVITNSENTSAPYNTEYGITPTNAAYGIQGPKTDNQWGLYTTVIQPGSITAYYNNKLIGTVETTRKVSDFGTNLAAYIGKSTYPDIFYKGGVRDVRVYTRTLEQEEVSALYYEGLGDEKAVQDALNADKESLTLPYTYVMEDISLPANGANGSAIAWSSDNQSYLSAEGKVTLPKDGEKKVTLTATLTLAGKSVTKEIPLTVLSDTADGWLTYYMEKITVSPSVLKSDVELPTKLGNDVTIAWESSNTKVLTADGKVTRPESGSGDVQVTLTAKVTYENVTKEKVFNLTVAEKAYGSILTYVKSGNKDRTDALHIGYSEDKGKTYKALNNNQPILYPSEGTKMMGSPVFFRKADGTYGVIADDNHSSGYVFLYDSRDLTSFTNPRYVRIDAGGNTVSNVSCVYNETEKAYEIYYEAGDAKSYVVSTTDFAVFTQPQQTVYKKEAVNATLPDGAIECGVFEVSKEEYDTILRKYSRVVNTDISKVEVKVETGSDKAAIEKPEKVTANYSDGTTKGFGVDWNETDWDKVDTSKPGTYTVKGTIRQPEYGNVLVEQRADPYVVKAADGTYYFTASYPVCGNAEDKAGIGYDRIILRHADTIEGLADAEEVVIWNQKDSSRANRYIWAPEMHYIGGSWYILFTASRSGNVWDIRPHMLQCMGDDPMNPGNWKTADESNLHQVTAKAGDTGMNGTHAFTDFSLDMTYFESAGKHYVVWAEKPGGISKIFMAEVNPDEPWQLISNTMLVSTPDYAWEWSGGTIINEGPAVLKHDGKIHLCFSGAAVDYTYCVGMVTAEEGADLLNPASWTKYPTPLLKSEDFEVEGYDPQCGPGHNSFTYDKDGNPVIVYHARPMNCSNAVDANGNFGQCEYVSKGRDGLNDPCRHARAKSLNFAADGTPILNMTPAEELSTKEVTLTVEVEETQAVQFYAQQGKELILPVWEVQSIASVIKDGEAITADCCTVQNQKISFAAPGGGTYAITYMRADGVNKTITVKVYAADNKAYVLDYGLKVDLNAAGEDSFGMEQTPGSSDYTMSGMELPQAGDAETAYLSGFRKKGSQDAYAMKVEDTDAVLEASGESLFYTPKAFMEDADVYEYQVEVKQAADGTITSSEDGVALSAELTVVPASNVYYEDDFSAIKVSGTFEKEGISRDMLQSNNQNDVYGYDAAYEEDTGIEKDLLLHYDFSKVQTGADGTVSVDAAVPDLSGNGKTGFIRRAGAAVNGDMLTLPGGEANTQSSYVELPDNLIIDKDAVTISFWMKNETDAGRNYIAMYMGSELAENGWPMNYWSFKPVEQNGNVSTTVTHTSWWDNPPTLTASAAGLSDKMSQYTVILKNGAMILYCDGRKVAENLSTGINLSELQKDGKQIGRIGISPYEANGDIYYKGDIRDVRIYDGALGDEEIMTLYRETKAEEGLLLHYDFSKVQTGADGTVSADTAVPDLSGNGYTGTIKQNNAKINGNVLTLPGGASGSDAAYVELPTGLTNDKTAMTVSVWLKSGLGNGHDYAAMYIGEHNIGNAGFPTYYWLLNPHNTGGNMSTSITTGGWQGEKAVASPATRDGELALYTAVIESGKLTFYCNEERIGENAATGINLADLGRELKAYIGMSAWRDKNALGDGDEYYKGDVCDVRIYDRALNASEVAALYKEQGIVPAKYTSDSMGSSTRLVAESGDARGMMEFTFKGTGLDVVGRTTEETAGIMAVIRDESGTVVKSKLVNTVYQNGKLYQLPIISIKNLDYGTYTVTIKALKAESEGVSRSVVYVDGIRIYDPAGVKTNADNGQVSRHYKTAEANANVAEIRELLLGEVRFGNQEGTSEGADTGNEAVQKASVSLVSFEEGSGIAILHEGNVLVEGTDGVASSADLKEILNKGANNEVYLGKGNAIAFRAVPSGSDASRTLQVEIKKATDEKDKKAQLTVLSEGANPQVVARKHHTAMYYEIDMSKCKQYEDGSLLVVLASTGDDMLSVTNLKCAGYEITALNDAEIAQTTMAADTLKLMSRAFSEDEENPDQKNPGQENPDQENPDQENPDPDTPDENPEITQKELPFEDVDPEGWYIENVRYVYEKEIMKGLTDTKFGPNDYLVRAQFAVILHRMNEAPTQEYKKVFPDVEAGIWYTDAILWASSVKVVNGYSNTKLFGPADNITREQMAVMMYRMAEYLGYDTSAQADISQYIDAEKIDGFAEKAMRWAVSNGIIKGKDYETVLDPLGNATRAECAAIIQRFIERFENSGSH